MSAAHANGDRLGIVRRSASECIGTALLLAAIVGSGIMGERLYPGSAGSALLANSIATGAALAALITCFAPLSGAHFNPAVSIFEAARGALPWKELPLYGAAQIVGAVLGVFAAHLMFGAPLFEASTRMRAGPAQLASEVLATAGLLILIRTSSARRPDAVPLVVAAYITAAYWFTSSTSFANPAVTIARSLTNSFSGIRAADVPGFIVAQMAGTVAAAAFSGWLLARDKGA